MSRAVCLLLALALQQQLAAADSDIQSTATASDATELTTSTEIAPSSTRQQLPLVKQVFFDIDTWELSRGPSSLTLRNPEGFDVATEVYDDGNAPTEFLDFGPPRVTLSAYAPSSIKPALRRRFAVSYDRVNFEGLKLRSLAGDIGMVVETGSEHTRLNLGISLGTGLTLSQSYSDRTVHPLIQASAHMRISLYRFFIEVVAIERLNLGRTLDKRKASPRLQSSTFMLGIRFW